MTHNEIIVKDFDRIALSGDKKLDHNRFYHKYLLNHLPAHANPVICYNVIS